MKKILALAALAAVLWSVVAFAGQDVLVADEVPVTKGHKKLTKWFRIQSQPQSALALVYTGDAETVAGDTLRLFIKSSGPDTTDGTRHAVVSRDLFHANSAMGIVGSATLDTMGIKLNPAAAGASVKWVIPLPVFIYPGEFISVWGARDSTANSTAILNMWHVGAPVAN